MTVPSGNDPSRSPSTGSSGITVSPDGDTHYMKTNTAHRSGAEQLKRSGTTLPNGSGAVQLRLLPGGTAEPDWVLDERTRKVGRQGVAQAREILRRLAPPDAVRRAS